MGGGNLIVYGLVDVAAGLGIGPRYRDSKSRVLPLDDPATIGGTDAGEAHINHIAPQ